MTTTSGQTRVLWPPIELGAEQLTGIAALGPLLRTSEAEAENVRHLPAPVVAAMHDAGLFLQSLPREVGGSELGPVAQMELIEAVARQSGAAGWNLFVGSLHTALPAAYLSDGAAEAMFARSGPNVVAGQMQPIGRGREVPGGMVVSGRYSWGSGITHARWVLAGAVLSGADGVARPGFRVVVVPKEHVTVLDNWHVVGVAGSGSYDYELDEVFVPEGWWFDYLAPVRHRGGPQFNSPIPAQIGPAHIGFALGLGERVLEEIVAVAMAKRRTNATGTVAERGTFQHALGLAYTRLSAARHLGAAQLARLDRLQRTGDPVAPALVEDIRAAASHATDTALAVASDAMRFAGGSVVRLDSPIQRLMRELLVAQAHMYVSDTNYETVGRSLLA
jgi:indole-3-acetate monooxygenase